MNKTRVLFLCTGNSCRSQMAQAFLNRHGGEAFEAHSAGLAPKEIHPLTLQVMQEIGYNMTGHSAKGVEVYLGKQLFQILITVCDDADKNCPTTWPGVYQRLHWSFEDPAQFEGSPEEKLAKFRSIRDQIQAKITNWLKEPKQPVAQ